MKLFTIGYEGLQLAEFVALLVEHDVETVVDVRELPLSRKAGFSKKALASALKQAGFEYIHMGMLGCPKPVRDCYREDGNWKRYTDGFLQHLNSQEVAIAELSAMARSSNCALLCYEADFNFCHRSMVADAVHKHSGVSVKHISAKKVRTRIPADLQLACA